MRPAEEMTNGGAAGAPQRPLGSELGARYRAQITIMSASALQRWPSGPLTIQASSFSAARRTAPT